MNLSPMTPVLLPRVIGKGAHSSGTIIFSYHLFALFTFHCATPMKLAVAACDNFNLFLLYFEATFHAEPLATPFLPLRQILATLKTLSSFSTIEAQAGVFDAIVWGVFQKQKISSMHGIEGLR